MRLPLFLAATLVIFFDASLFATNTFAATPLEVTRQPSWFPSVSCREAWRGKDRARFDFVKDGTYANYRERLKHEQVAPRESCYKDWTVLVYMAADNDLSPYALWDLHEMEGPFKSGNFAASTLKSDLIVEADTAGRTGIRRIHMYQAPGEYQIPKSKQEFVAASPSDVRSPVISIKKEDALLTADDHKKGLQDYLDWGMRAYPAQHYMVVVWGHGLTFGESSAEYMKVPALGSVLSDVKHNTLEDRRTIDVYVSDSCLMQTLETAYEFSDSTRFIVGSAQVQSYLGLPYRQLMYEINTGRFGHAKANVGADDEPYLVARLLPTLAQKSLDPVRGQQGRADKEASKQFTMSALSSESLSALLVPAVRTLGSALKDYIGENSLRRADLKFLVKQTPNFMSGSRELASFIGLLEIQIRDEAKAKNDLTTAAGAVLASIEGVRNALQMTVISSAFGTRYSTEREPFYLLGFKAIGIWIPGSEQEYEHRTPEFALSRFMSEETAVAPSWRSWLTALYAP